MMTLEDMEISIQALEYIVEEHKSKIHDLENLVSTLLRGKEPRK